MTVAELSMQYKPKVHCMELSCTSGLTSQVGQWISLVMTHLHDIIMTNGLKQADAEARNPEEWKEWICRSQGCRSQDGLLKVTQGLGSPFW